MNAPIVVVGIGEMAGVFSRGFLKQGYPVFPVTRQMAMDDIARAITPPALVLVAVGENDLHPTLEKIPPQWRDRIGLLQNELLPRDWQQHQIATPTVVAVWFEKKRGQDYKVLIPSPVFGPAAPLLEASLESLAIPVWELETPEALTFELVRKNVYILTTNIAGLEVGGTAGSLWERHQGLARAVAGEVMDIQFRLTGHELDREKLLAGMVEAIEGDREHPCMGRSAPDRLRRAIAHADQFDLAVPKLRALHADLG